jgi:hypothetical protein
MTKFRERSSTPARLTRSMPPSEDLVNALSSVCASSQRLARYADASASEMLLALKEWQPTIGQPYNIDDTVTETFRRVTAADSAVLRDAIERAMATRSAEDQEQVVERAARVARDAHRLSAALQIAQP